jgi:ferredoxin
MSTAIFYFSGTGNCLKVARDLARELGDADIFNIAKVIDKEIDLTADRIGIIYPVYMFGMPLIVTRFVRQLKAAQNKYIFAIATCGGKAANTLKQNAILLKSQGLKLAAGFIIKMPGNYTPLYGAIPLEKQKKMFEKEKQRVKEIAGIVKDNRQYKIEKDAFLLRGLLSIIYQLMSPKIPFLDKDFWADKKCTSCGICVKVCPVSNIKLCEGKPAWLHKCEQCFACLHWCPEEAIQYGKNTSGKKRYRNPEIKLEDLIINK